MSTLLCFWQKVFVLNKTNMCIKIMKYFLNSTWICLTHRCPEHESIWLTTAKNMTLFDSHLYRTWLCLPHCCPGHESVWLTAALNKTLFDSLLPRTALFRTGLCLTQPCPEQRCCFDFRPIRLAGWTPFVLSNKRLDLQGYALPGSRTIILYSRQSNNNNSAGSGRTQVKQRTRRWWMAASGRAGGCSGAPPGCTGSVERF